MLFEETDSRAAPGVPPPQIECGSELSKSGSQGRVQGVQASPQAKPRGWFQEFLTHQCASASRGNLFSQGWQNPRAQRVVQAPLRGAQGQETSHPEFCPICFTYVFTSLLWARFGGVTIQEHVAGGHSQFFLLTCFPLTVWQGLSTLRTLGSYYFPMQAARRVSAQLFCKVI